MKKRELEPQLEMPAVKKLYEALAKIDKPKDMALFLRDLLTFEEIEEASRRLLIAKNLKKGKSTRDIAKEFGVSTTTVVRINYWLHHGMGGYDLALKKLNK
ncbi:MAG TPA: YerC/YecD family TrpR-related protein [Patescibacteria group bacterium]|nr:YerC/YecD family TrpR-related protein [Patescibacteria group bacterium]